MTIQRTWFRLPARLDSLLVLSAGLALGSCAQATNLLSHTGPRFLGHYAPTPAASTDSTIRIATFNIRYALEIDRAIEVLRDDSLRGADILALQEMDTAGVERIARTLGYDYAFYPAVIHPTSRRYFGPALLSRWPIERSWKVLLPHAGWTRGQRRTATAAIVRIRETRVLAYSTHLETPVQLSDRKRADQAQALLEDAADWRGPVVIAGDFNSERVGLQMAEADYVWLTRRIGPTVAWFSWDHVFVRGLAPSTPRSAGVVHDNRGASDHLPVWAVATVIPSGARDLVRTSKIPRFARDDSLASPDSITAAASMPEPPSPPASR
jgi:endonuclease/exonuclease/phosphatase family metal-dependent hydrolase